MPVPIQYRRVSESGIASYNFIDMVKKVGYKTFYLCEMRKAEATVYTLVPDTLLAINNATPSAGTTFEMNFDLNFDFQTIIKGDVFISIPIGMSDGNWTVDYTLKIYKVRGGSETQLGSTITGTATATPGAGTVWRKIAGVANVGIVQFKPNDTFRLEIYFSSIDAGVYVFVYHDPMNLATNATFLSYQSKVNIPFSIEL